MSDRRDAWTLEEDQLLADLVLEHIRNGSTQLKAFEEAGERLERTSSACGFRFNSVVRKTIEESLKQAKAAKKGVTQKAKVAQRDEYDVTFADETSKSDPVPVATQSETEETRTETFDAAETLDKLKSYIAHLESEIRRLQNENDRLKNKVMQEEPKDDLTHLIAILDRARQSGMLEHIYGKDQAG